MLSTKSDISLNSIGIQSREHSVYKNGCQSMMSNQNEKVDSDIEENELDSNISIQSDQNTNIQYKVLAQENQRLKQKLFEKEINERKLMSKILELQKNTLKRNMEMKQYIISTQQHLSQAKSVQNKQNKYGSKKSVETDKEGKQRKQQRKFIDAIKENYKQMFGLQSLKQIWKKHKQIIAQWVLHQ